MADGLIHYYPFRENINDIIGGEHGYDLDFSTRFTTDRFGKPNRAL